MGAWRLGGGKKERTGRVGRNKNYFFLFLFFSGLNWEDNPNCGVAAMDWPSCVWICIWWIAPPPPFFFLFFFFLSKVRWKTSARTWHSSHPDSHRRNFQNTSVMWRNSDGALERSVWDCNAKVDIFQHQVSGFSFDYPDFSASRVPWNVVWTLRTSHDAINWIDTIFHVESHCSK